MHVIFIGIEVTKFLLYLLFIVQEFSCLLRLLPLIRKYKYRSVLIITDLPVTHIHVQTMKLQRYERFSVTDLTNYSD